MWIWASMVLSVFINRPIWIIFEINHSFCVCHTYHEIFTLKAQNKLLHLASLQSLSNTPLLNRLQSNDVENTAVIEAPETVFLPVETVQRIDDDDEPQGQSVINESETAHRSSYEEEDVQGASVIIQEEEVNERDDESAALTTTTERWNFRRSFSEESDKNLKK